MIRKIAEFMEKNNMLDGCENVVVGLSGGADSVCLLNVLKRVLQNTKITAVHINHGIRGEEADRDEKFAENMAKQMGVDFLSFRLDIPAKAHDEGISEETAGRIARYECFRKVACELGAECTKIAVAHHMDDQAETVLMHMIRGSGVTGLVGMRAVAGDVIRPLLCVSRQEIERYLSENRIDYVTDSTNFDSSYTRNMVRQCVIPDMEKINSRFKNCVNSMATDVARYEDFVSRMTDEAQERFVKIEKNCADTGFCKVLIGIGAADEDELILTNLVKRAYCAVHGDIVNLYRVHIEDAAKLFFADCGKSTDLPGGVVARRQADGVVFTVADSEEKPDLSEWECVLDIAEKSGKIKFGFTAYGGVSGISWEVVEKKELINFGNNDYTKYFDYDIINVKPVVRFRKSGDTCVIDNQGHRKKLKQELIDRKVPSTERDSVLLLTCGSDVIWAAGVRRYQEFLVTEDTKRVLKVELR